MHMMISKCHFINLDTLIKGNSIKLGADVFIDTLQKSGIPFLIFTEQCNKTSEQLCEHLASIGIKNIKPNQIYTTAMAAIDWIANKANHLHRFAYVGTKALKNTIESANYQIDFINPEVVLVGMDRNMTYREYCDISNSIQNAKYFISIDNRNKEKVDGIEMIGNKAIVRMLEVSSNKKAMDFGRGSEISIHMALLYLGLGLEDVVCVGSNFKKDIVPAHNLGIDTVFVTEGKGVLGLGMDKGLHPTYLVEDLYGLTK